MVSTSSFLFSSTLLALSAAYCAAFEMSFPNNGNEGYWVTNATNVLNWKANSTDPTPFSVQLLNSDNNQLNGNFQIGNALVTSAGTANIFIDEIPEGNYQILFVNSSMYALNNPQVFYTSEFFSLRPNGTMQIDVTPNSNADPSSTDSDSNQSASGSSKSADATLVPTGTGSGEGSGAFSLGGGMGWNKAVGVVVGGGGFGSWNDGLRRISNLQDSNQNFEQSSKPLRIK